MTVALVWAEGQGRVIGSNGALPWHLPEDLAHFRRLTTGGAVIMGRRTWLSIPEQYRPLPDRRNVVITRQGDWQAPGALVAHSLEEALELAGTLPVWVIGGAEIFALAIARADQLDVTVIRAGFDGDALAPVIDGSWHLVARDPDDGWHRSRTGLDYRIDRYLRHT